MLRANYEFARSMDCPAQSNDCIDTLCNKPWISCALHGLSTLLFAQSMDLAQ